MDNLMKMRVEILTLMETVQYKMDDSVKQTFEHIASLNTQEAIEYLSNFVEENKYGGCIHLAAWLHTKFPDKLTLGFVPHIDSKTGKKSSKFLNVLNIEGENYVIDIITPLETGHTSAVSMLAYFIGIPSFKYITQDYTSVCELTILPNPNTTDASNQPFVEYCFKNEKATTICNG